MKMKTEDILEKIKELKWYVIDDFITPLDLTPEQFKVLFKNEDWYVREAIAERSALPEDLIYKMAEDEDYKVRWGISLRSDLPEDLIIRLSCDYWEFTRQKCFEKLKKLNNLKSEDLENAYDFIRTSKYISRKDFKYIFNYIISNFPELSEAAKLFKNIILKGKRDLK